MLYVNKYGTLDMQVKKNIYKHNLDSSSTNDPNLGSE